MTKIQLFSFRFLCVLFGLYTLNIYTMPIHEGNLDESKEKIAEGRLLWQKHNCQTCHQLYGLGGYLGPDLTNLMKNEKGGLEILKQMLNKGPKQMPKFQFSEEEIVLLSNFLKEVNLSGTSNPQNFISKLTGNIELYERKNK